MKLKKNPKANLEHFSRVFTLLGLVLTLFISYVFIEHKSYAAIKKPTAAKIEYTIDEEKTIPFSRIKEKPKKIEQPITIEEPQEKPIKKTKVIDPNNITKADNDLEIIDLPIADTGNEIPTEIIDEGSLDYDPELEIKNVETIDYVSVENIPVYPGCEKYMYDKEKSKKCFSKKISKFFGKEFDSGIAADLNLTGLQSIKCQFIIDENGAIKPDIKTTKTHPELAKEIKSVLAGLPKMIPAKQNGRAVNLRYVLPVKFLVE